MREYNAESPKQGRKRFNSIAKTQYIADLVIIYLWVKRSPTGTYRNIAASSNLPKSLLLACCVDRCGSIVVLSWVRILPLSVCEKDRVSRYFQDRQIDIRYLFLIAEKLKPRRCRVENHFMLFFMIYCIFCLFLPGVTRS